MTIKEMEKLSGMTRANIRFYESEGLFHPARDHNGYRNYTLEDLEMLRKIRLLRAVHMSLDDIKSVVSGRQQLSEVLLRHVKTLKGEENELENCRKICEDICLDRASYESLDAGHYLEMLQSGSAGCCQELKEDTLPKVEAPWQRFFARRLDFFIYDLIWYSFLSLVMHINIASLHIGVVILGVLMQIALMLFLEPLMLTLTGTTPGKLIFGMRVTRTDGSRLTWREALQRTGRVLSRGCGFNIPFYDLICLYRSYTACKKGEMLEWEEESVLVKKESHAAFRGVVYAAAAAFLTAAGFFIWQAGSLPPNRGSLTVAEFCKNYNATQEFYDISRPVNVPDTYLYNYMVYPMILDDNGQWQNYPGISQSFGKEFSELPHLSFSEKQGTVTKISFSMSYTDENVTVTPYSDFMALAAISYICAQEDYSVFQDPPQEIYERIKEQADEYGNFAFAAGGVMIRCSVDFSGYEWTEGGAMLVPEYGGNPDYHIEFSMTTI